ncbi:branched-chain amino acid ABC transporter permease [Spirillospora sp. CA-255316]
MTIILSGLAVGSVFALVALMLNLPLAQSGVFNLAQAQIMVVGFFVTYGCITRLGLAWPIAALIAAVVCAFVAFVEDLVAIRPLATDTHHGTLVTTVGFTVILEGVVLVVWGDQPRSLGFFGGDEPFELAGGRTAPVQVTIVAVAVIVAVALHLVSTRTRWGLQGRATTEDASAAQLRGVNVNFMRTGSLVLAGLLGGLLGVVLAPAVGLAPGLSFGMILHGFVALTVGGVGSNLGALVAGLSLGVVDALVARYAGAEWSALVIFAVLLAFLTAVPQGLFGRRDLRVV